MRDAMATRRRKTATTDTNGMKTNVSAGETKDGKKKVEAA